MVLLSIVIALCIVATSSAIAAPALGPDDVFIIVNRNVPDSSAIAEHYCSKRGVPADQEIALDLPAGEDISRADYDAKLAGPLREALNERRDQVKVLLTLYGVPLRVGAPEPNADERAELETIRRELEPLEQQRGELDEAIKALENHTKDEPQGPAADELAQRRKDRSELEERIRPLQDRVRFLSYQESQAAVDSELALLWHAPYELRRFQPNPLYFQLPEHGAAATLGPVAEPYTIGFPKPAEFFGTLATGDYTLVESYWRTALFASWMTVLVGDPLYMPFARSPLLKIDQVRPSPLGTQLRATKEP